MENKLQYNIINLVTTYPTQSLATVVQQIEATTHDVKVTISTVTNHDKFTY